jgi:OPT family oligopeptide transporter
VQLPWYGVLLAFAVAGIFFVPVGHATTCLATYSGAQLTIS